MFWLSYECFSKLCNVFLPKIAISSHNSCVAGMEKTFFAIFDATCTHIFALKIPNKEFLKQHLVKKDRDHIIINFVTLRLT